MFRIPTYFDCQSKCPKHGPVLVPKSTQCSLHGTQSLLNPAKPQRPFSGPPYIIIKSVSFNKKICRCVWDSCHYCVCFGILHKITRHCVKDPYKNYYCPYTCKLHTTHFLVTALLHSSLNKSRLQQVWLLISKFVHSWIS